MNYPKHEEFLKKYISITAGFIDAFNTTHKIKSSSSLSLNATEELKNLKDLLDSGAITNEEFKKAKEKLLN